MVVFGDPLRTACDAVRVAPVLCFLVWETYRGGSPRGCESSDCESLSGSWCDHESLSLSVSLFYAT